MPRQFTDADLMAHHDGELAGAEGERLRDAIADDATARAKLEALGQIATLVRGEVEAEVEDSLAGADPFASMWSRIEQRVAAEAAPEKAPAAAPASEPRGFLASIRGWLEGYRSQLITGAVSAAAAAALVWFLRPPDKSVEYVEVGSTSQQTGVTPVALKPQPPEVENLEVYDGSGVVFTIPDDDGGDSETAVIWLTPPENPVEGPI